MLGMARGVAKWVADQQTVNIPQTWINELAVTFPRPEWLIVAPGVWLTRGPRRAGGPGARDTVFGRRVFAIGSNEAAARACGIPVDRMKIWIYGLAGLLFGLSGVMQMSRLRQGDPTVAIGTELDVIAAVVIGGGSAERRRGHDPRLDDRRQHHGRAAERQPADGLAELHPGNHHRRDHRGRCGGGSGPEPEAASLTHSHDPTDRQRLTADLSETMRLLLLGYGRMGKLVEALAPEYGCEVAGVLDETSNQRGEGLLPGRWPGVDVAIDFSIAGAVEDNVRALAAAGINVVIGTTGWQDASARVREVVERSGIGAVAAPNFSTGAILFGEIVESSSAACWDLTRNTARTCTRCITPPNAMRLRARRSR